jgi:hypothetical protein
MRRIAVVSLKMGVLPMLWVIGSVMWAGFRLADLLRLSRDATTGASMLPDELPGADEEAGPLLQPVLQFPGAGDDLAAANANRAPATATVKFASSEARA